VGDEGEEFLIQHLWRDRSGRQSSGRGVLRDLIFPATIASRNSGAGKIRVVGHTTAEDPAAASLCQGYRRTMPLLAGGDSKDLRRPTALYLERTPGSRVSAGSAYEDWCAQNEQSKRKEQLRNIRGVALEIDDLQHMGICDRLRTGRWLD
jgi:hypothetical protein